MSRIKLKNEEKSHQDIYKWHFVDVLFTVFKKLTLNSQHCDFRQIFSITKLLLTFLLFLSISSSLFPCLALIFLRTAVYVGYRPIYLYAM